MLPKLNNRYFGLRHGESEGNVAGLVVSDPEVGCNGYGLTAAGRLQVEAAVNQNSALDGNAITVCSDFKRAQETAEIAVKLLGAIPPQYDDRLRERYFGAWDMKPNTSYATVWDKDAMDPSQTIGNVESAVRVSERLCDLIESIEMTYSGETILLVSHGDPLHLAQALFENRSPSEHRLIPNWETAEIRELERRL